VLVRPQHFTSDADAARRLLHRPAATRLMALDASCDVALGRGQRISATYQRAPAVLLFRRPASGTQVVDLFVCGSPRPVRSATLPHP
jgi:hypothetical protein